jgi:hypothetical protein
VTGITATNNIILGVARPIVDDGVGNATSPNAINLTGYINPRASAGSYNASLGGSDSLAAFLKEARKQSKDSWRVQYTAKAVINYIQAGFDLGISPTSARPH